MHGVDGVPSTYVLRMPEKIRMSWNRAAYSCYRSIGGPPPALVER
jgi:hypothetical protein